MFAKLPLFALAALAPLTALSAQTEADGRDSGEAARTTTERAAPAARQERRICRRVGLTGQPTSIRRVCLTAAEWREVDDSE